MEYRNEKGNKVEMSESEIKFLIAMSFAIEQGQETAFDLFGNCLN